MFWGSFACVVIFLIYFIDYTITVAPIFSLCPPPSSTIHSLWKCPLSSCPWVMHISSLASPFPILFLTSPYFVPTNYASYSLYLFPNSPSPFSLITLQVISVSMILFLFWLFGLFVFAFFRFSC